MGGAHAHSHSHAHGHGFGDGHHHGLASRVVLGLVMACLVAAIVGMAVLWPGRSAIDALRSSQTLFAPGTTFVDGTITKLSGDSAAVDLSKGDIVNVDLPPSVVAAGVSVGSKIKVATVADPSGAPMYSYYAVHRSTPLWILFAVFAGLLLVIGRLRGLMALIGLAIAGLAVWYFVLPALVSGSNAAIVTLCACTIILAVVLYSTHGFSVWTSIALLGTLAGAAITVVLATWVTSSAHLTGIANDDGLTLSSMAPHFDPQSVLVATSIIAAVGVLNDVTVTQASAVAQLRVASPTMTRFALWRSGMAIGRDHIGSAVYTIVFAYVGGSIVSLMLLNAFDQPLLGLMGSEDLVEEIARVLVASIGLILAVPLTTALAAVSAVES